MNYKILYTKREVFIMECKKCGVVLEEDALFCVACGTKIGEEAENAPALCEEATACEAPAEAESAAAGEKAEKPQFQLKLDKEKIIGLVVGSLIILLGFIRVLSAGTSISPTSFGGDFYTYTYRGIVAISEQLAAIQASLGWIIVAIGAAIDVYVLRK